MDFEGGGGGGEGGCVGMGVAFLFFLGGKPVVETAGWFVTCHEALEGAGGVVVKRFLRWEVAAAVGSGGFWVFGVCGGFESGEGACNGCGGEIIAVKRVRTLLVADGQVCIQGVVI